jgi:hypothetical protein
MLRRPGDCSANHLGEGCSSNAFDANARGARAFWFNPADRGDAQAPRALASALPRAFREQGSK